MVPPLALGKWEIDNVPHGLTKPVVGRATSCRPQGRVATSPGCRCRVGKPRVGSTRPPGSVCRRSPSSADLRPCSVPRGRSDCRRVPRLDRGRRRRNRDRHSKGRHGRHLVDGNGQYAAALRRRSAVAVNFIGRGANAGRAPLLLVATPAGDRLYKSMGFATRVATAAPTVAWSLLIDW